MSTVCSQPFSIRAEPDIDRVILGSGEQQVSFLVEDDLRERTLVTGEKNGFLGKNDGGSDKRAGRYGRVSHHDDVLMVCLVIASIPVQGMHIDYFW